MIYFGAAQEVNPVLRMRRHRAKKLAETTSAFASSFSCPSSFPPYPPPRPGLPGKGGWGGERKTREVEQKVWTVKLGPLKSSL